MKERLKREWGDTFRLKLKAGPPAKVPPLKVQIFENVKVPTGYSASRRYSPEHIAAIEGEVAGLQRIGIIAGPSGPVVVSCVHMVRKPGGRGWRMTVDYRRINACTVPEAWPFPRLEDLLQRIPGARVFGCLDLLKGFWQFPLYPPSRKYYAFKTHDAIYEWTRVPMGARNAATHFQRVMTDIFRKAGLLHKGVLV